MEKSKIYLYRLFVRWKTDRIRSLPNPPEPLVSQPIFPDVSRIIPNLRSQIFTVTNDWIYTLSHHYI